MINKILDYLDELYPNPKCELEYTKDYELLIAIVMSAQTTDKRVNMVNKVLFKKYQSVKELSEASLEDIEKIIKPIGTYKKKAFPGVGRKTINVFLSVIYNEPLVAVDTHVNRVSKRLKLAKDGDDVLEVEKKLMKKIPKDKWNKVHHQLVFFGRYKCKSISPLCTDCKLKDICKYYSVHSKPRS